ncbi:response regulator [Pseudoflavonifractor sp. AF19-9AC]|uniref:response regulator transcription factor n=1 Tax=Pseudoflavonifractor sp. AF19-9AC TaxID=2292244 RepID=UPI00325B811F
MNEKLFCYNVPDISKEILELIQCGEILSMRILIVEDETELLQDIAKGLTLKGYAVDQANDGKTGCQMALDEEYDLVVLDLNLPGKDGFSILKELRRERPQTNVLILSANSELDSKLSGFELGASDYLTKPFHFAELEARIRVLLNRKFVQQSSCLTYQEITLNTLNRTMEINGVPISLTTKEFAILEYFLLNQGRLITQQELIEHVWNGDADPFSNSVRVHLSALRKKLKSPLGRDPIQTRIGEGYLLC